MDKRKLIAVIVVVILVTFSLFLIGLQGRLFQSSILGGEGESDSGVTLLSLSGDASLAEFPVNEEKTLEMSRDLVAAGIQEVGFYFPKVYNVRKGTKGNIVIGHKLSVFQPLERKLQIDLLYQSEHISYIGEDSLQIEGANVLVANNSNDGRLTVEIIPSTDRPLSIGKDAQEFLEVPFEVHADTSATGPLLFQIEEVSRLSFPTEDAEAEVALPHWSPVTEVLFVGDAMPTDTEKPQEATTVITSEVASKQDIFTEEVQADPNAPRITSDNSRVSPSTVIEGSGETIFVYLSVFDPDGSSNLDDVNVDLSSIGLGEKNKLLLIEASPEYYVYATSFILPDETGANTYTLPYQVSDKQDNQTSGVLKFTVQGEEKEENTPNITTYNQFEQPEIISADINGDGIVNVIDLTLFLDAYQKTAR